MNSKKPQETPKIKSDLDNKKKKVEEKKKREEDDPVVRSIYMVVFYTLSNFLLKLIMAILSLTDVLLLITRDYSMLNVLDFTHYFDFEYFMNYICSASRICQVIRKYGNLLYLVSLTINILFFYNFDKKFKLAFRRLFFKDRKKTVTNTK